MKAYQVRFNTAGSSGHSEILLVNEESELEVALEAKSKKPFKVGDSYSNITTKKEIPLSQVKLADLSIPEFLSLNQLKKDDTI